MPTTPIPANLPARLDSATLAKYIQDGEPVIVAKFLGVGNTSPYDYRAKDNRAYVFRYDPKLEGHVLRIPLRIWQGDGKKRPTDNLAHAMMDERRMPHPMVITVEMPKVVPMEQPSLTDPLIAALIADPEFAWSWHCHIARACYDKGARTHAQCNAGAALFLSRLTDGKVDTTTHPAYAEITKPTEFQEQGASEASEAHNLGEAGATPAPASTLTESHPEMGAADTIPAQNVVGLSDEPTAASAVDWKQPEGDVVYKVAVDDSTSEQVTEAAALYDQAFDLVESPKRIKSLAALLGVEEGLLRDSIDLPESKVELANAGWVRRKESPTA